MNGGGAASTRPRGMTERERAARAAIDAVIAQRKAFEASYRQERPPVDGRLCTFYHPERPDRECSAFGECVNTGSCSLYIYDERKAKEAAK